MANKLYCELSEFNEATQPKTSLAKYSIEFNDVATPNTVFEAVRQTLHITVYEKICRQTNYSLELWTLRFIKQCI